MQFILEMSLFNAHELIMFLQVSSHSPNQVQPWKDDRCLYVLCVCDSIHGGDIVPFVS